MKTFLFILVRILLRSITVDAEEGMYSDEDTNQFLQNARKESRYVPVYSLELVGECYVPVYSLELVGECYHQFH